MGALGGSASTCKFQIGGTPPKNLRKSFMERIRLRVFQPLVPEEEEEERFGWCAVSQPAQLEFAPHDVFQGPYVTLGLRWDRYRFPAPVIAAAYTEAVRRKRSETGRDQLSRTEKTELKAQVMSQLRHRYLPSSRQVDLVWHVEGGHLHFWSSSGPLIERFETLFELTFGLETTRNSPFVAACLLLDGTPARRQLDTVELGVFHGG